MSTDDQQLASFQAAMLEALAEHDRADDVMAALRNAPAAEPFIDYVESFEPRMLEVAAELLKKWGRRGAGSA